VRFPFIAFTALAMACASGSHASTASPASTDPKPAAASNADQSQLTSTEITAANLPTAYDLVDRLRRPWLRRDAMTGADVVVYQDNQNIGGAEKLREIPAATVSAMQFMPNADAIRRYGNDVKGSVIVVVIRR
jgi:hypothetical protein